YAAAAGTILAAGYYGPSWGSIMLIRHTLPTGQVVLTQYAYIADVTKTTGTVGWRDLIGHVGIGRGGAVLHLAVRRANLVALPPAPPPEPVWDGVPHLDGSILKSAAGSYYLLQSGKKWLIASNEVLATWARPEEALPATDAELASYPNGSHPLGLRSGTLF